MLGLAPVRRAPSARSPRRATALAVLAALLLPTVLGAIAPAWAEPAPQGPTVTWVVVYDDAAHVPTDGALAARGLTLLYRMGAIPGLVLAGPASVRDTMPGEAHVAVVDHDEPLQYFLQTAVFSTNVADVWAEAWWPVASEVQRRDPSPLLADGQVVDGRGIVVGVVDSGIDARHPDLWYAPAPSGPFALQPKVLGCYLDPVIAPPTANGTLPTCDPASGHGTHVAGIVAGNAWAARNGMAPGVDPQHPPMGAAPGAQLIGMGLGVGISLPRAVASLDWMAVNADRLGIRIVTNSWGTTGSCPGSFPGGSVILAQNALVAKGVTVLFAAGNYDTLGNPTWTSPYAQNPTPGVISVANYNDQGTGSRDGAIAGSSSDGCVGSGGAGGDHLWTWPDVGAPGSSITSTASATGAIAPGLDGVHYSTISGTSMATPHVAGIVALMLQANPDLTPAQVERILIETAKPWLDGTSARGQVGTSPMWGPFTSNNPTVGFNDPSRCKVTPEDAAKAELGDTTINAKFPRFTELAAITDADLFVCRDFKRGRGLVDGYAAVQRALELRGGTGMPSISLTSPQDGAQVEAGPLDVEGVVDRRGGAANQAPTAGLSADKVSGPAPLAVSFTALGSDADGTIASWSLDFGDGTAAASGATLPASVPHTYAADGTHEAVLTVTDDKGATGTDTLAIRVGGLPVPDGRITGSVFAYNGGAIGASNVGALVVGAATGDNVPKYVAGDVIGVASRSTTSSDPAIDLTAGTPFELVVFDAEGRVAYGPVPMTGSAENPALAGCTDCYSYDAADFQIPVTWGGRYYLAPRGVIGSERIYVYDEDYGGLKPIDVVGAGLVTSAPLPLRAADLDHASFTAGEAPVAFGSEDDPEAEDAADDTQGDLAFVDIRKLWIGLETSTTFDLHLKVDDLGSKPPGLNVATPGGTARVSTNYGAEFCLDNNPNAARADGLFCYRLSAVDSVLGPVFSGAIIQRDDSGSCSISGTVESGSFDTAQDTVSWRLLKAGFNVTANSAAVADCTTTPPVRGGNPVRDGNVLSLLEGSTGFSAGARVILTTGNGGDSTDPGNARPYTFGSSRTPLQAEAGGPYSGVVGASIALAGSATGGQPPYDCTWSGASATFAAPDSCSTLATFPGAGTFQVTLTVNDGAGATAQDTAQVTIGGLAGERVELRLDTEADPRASIPVSSSEASPRATFRGSLDLRGVAAGPHELVATWVDADGTVLAVDRVPIRVRGSGAPAFVTIANPAHDPSGASPVGGTITLEGQAGHQGVPAAASGLGLPELRAAAVREGYMAIACNLCQSSPAGPGDLTTSATFRGADPGGLTDNVDGAWVDVAGLSGRAYTMGTTFGSPADIYFFAEAGDPQGAALGTKVGAAMPKSGTVPDGANWAFTYLRRLGANVANAQGFDDTATFTFPAPLTPPSAPQLLEAIDGQASVTLTWLPSAEHGGDQIDGFKVYRDGALLNTLGATTLTFKDDGLVAGTTYSYEVSALNALGEGPRAGPVRGTPTGTPDPLAITSPGEGSAGHGGDVTLAGTYAPRAVVAPPPPQGNFANTYYFFLMNLNNDRCVEDLGHGDILIASRLISHARTVLGVPDANVRFFNQDGGVLCRTEDPDHYDQLPPEFQSPYDPFDGPAKMAPFTASLREAAQSAVAEEEAGGAPARIFILQSSHGIWSPAPDHATGSLMALQNEDVQDRAFGDAITQAFDDAEAGTDVAIEVAVLIDCSFCGGFGDSPFWFPGTTTTAVDSARVVGPNRVVEVGCTWITECFGNPAVTYDHIFNECTFRGKGDGYGPAIPSTGVGHPAPGGSGDVNGDVVLPSATHHPKDGAITLEEAYWCALDSVKGSLGPMGGPVDVIGIQQMFQLIDQMDSDLFTGDGFVLWDTTAGGLDLRARDRDAALPPLASSLLAGSAEDEAGDALLPWGDFLGLEARATADGIVLEMTIADLTLQSAQQEDLVEFRPRINDQLFGICYVQGRGATVYDYDGGGYIDADVAYDFARNTVHVEIPYTLLGDPSLPASVWAMSGYGACFRGAEEEDDRVPDEGTVLTGEDDTTDPGEDQVRVRLEGPGGARDSLAALDAPQGKWTLDPPGDLAQGTYTATVEHWFDDGSGFVRVDGPLQRTFTVGTPDTTPPTAPTSLFVAGTTPSTASLTWDAATDDVGVVQYRVYRSGAPGVPLLPANLVGSPTGLAFVDQDLAPSTDYYYVVLAEDAAGNRGPASNEVLATTQSPPPIDEKVTLLLDGAFLRHIPVDTLGGNDPTTWSTTLDTTTLADGFHTLRAEYDDGRGGTAQAEARFNVQNGVGIAIAAPADGDLVGQDLTVQGSATEAAPGSVVQVQARNAGGVVRGWSDAAFDGTAWSQDLQGLPFGALTLEARLRDGTVTVAQDSVQVRVVDADRVAALEANGQPLGEAQVGPLSGVVPIEGSSHLASEADPRVNVPPVAAIGDVVVLGRSLRASGAGSYDPDGRVVHHAWSLGDGSTTSGASIAHAYAAPGDYTLTLTVTDNRGASSQAVHGPFRVDDTVGDDLVVDAGDSRFHRSGEPLALLAQAHGATAPVQFYWDTDMDGQADRSGQSILVDTTGTEGSVTYQVWAQDAAGLQGTDTVRMFLYVPTTKTYEWTDIVPAGIPDELAGTTNSELGNTVHTIQVPEGSTSLDAVLTWTVYADVLPPSTPVTGSGGPNDHDLYVFGPDGFSISSADFNMPEEVHLVEPAGGEWRFETHAFLATPDILHLRVDVGEAPPNPVPRADQVSEVCFESATQTIVASARVATGTAITGAWDLDNDGAFDDASGFTAQTNFPLDGQAHLVRFRATTSDGYRSTVYLGVRPMADCPDAPSVVVVGIADSGINPYHREFAGEVMPYPALKAYTTADAEIALPGDALVRHKLTNEVLPFTKHPSRYIPGFPADAKPLVLTLGGGYYKSQDDAQVWSKGHGAIPLGKWFWIPGTKIVGAMDASDAAAINGDPDVAPILDEDGHGSGSAAVAVGNLVGSCPRCVLAFIEGLNGDTILMQQPWIDLVSFSFGSVGNVGTPVVSDEAVSRAAAERGMTVSYAAGNGNENAFVTPQNTYTSNSLGPDWTVDVGAVSKTTNSAMHGTGKPVDWSSYGSGAIPGACTTNYAGNCGHSGTSAATPISTGHLGTILLNVRSALGDTQAGPKDPALAGGQRQALAVGQAIPGSPALADGVLQRHELWDAAFHCASPLGTSVGFPGSLPRSQHDYAYAGHGVADKAMELCASNALLTGAALPAKPDADAFYEADEFIRDELWGDWDGDGDGNPGGNHNRPDSPDFPPQALGMGDVDTLGKSTRVLAALLGSIGQAQAAPGPSETWFLRHDGECSELDPGHAYMSQQDGSDVDLCGGGGTPPLLGETCCPTEVWPAEGAMTGGFDAGALVDGAVYLDFAHPGAPQVQFVLLADGIEVGRSAVASGPATGTFGILGLSRYDVAFPTTAPIAAGAQLELQMFITGSPTYFVGYEGDHASALTITGPDTPEGPTVAIVAPGQGQAFDKASTTQVEVRGSAANADRVEVSVDDATFASGTLAVAGIGSWTASWSLAAASPGPHTLYARACLGAVCSAAASRGVVVEDSSGTPTREGRVELQMVPEGQPVASAGWVAATAYDPATGEWTHDWDTTPLANGDWDVHVRLLGDGAEVARDAFRALLRNSRAPVLGSVADQEVVEGNTLAFGLAATDQDGDPIAFSAEGLPAGALLEDHGDGTATITWQPRFDQSGSYEVTVEASDGGASDRATLTITAHDATAALRGDGRGFRTVQGAVDAALAGETVVVLPGVHAQAATIGGAITLCSTAANVRTPAQVACQANAAGTTLAPAAGSALTITATGATVQHLTLDAADAGVLLDGAQDATLTGLVLRDGVDGIRAVGGSGHALQGNRYEGPSTGLRLDGVRSVRAEGERFEGAGTALALAATAGQPASNVLTRSCIRGATTLVRVASDVAGQVVDVRANDWGTYRDSAIRAGFNDQGSGNTIQYRPFLAEDCATPLLPPTAAFTRAPEVAYAVVDQVQFTDRTQVQPGSRAIATWRWAFGDGAGSAEQHPAHTYAAPGTVTATLTVTDAAELTHSASVAFFVHRWFAPNASLLAAPTTTDRLTPVQFTDASSAGSGAIVQRVLDFGDGAASTTTTVEHTYATLGRFTATLTLTDAKGQAGTSSVLVDVRNIPPVASGAADATRTDRLTPVRFTEASLDRDGSVVAWTWTFGDGATSTERQPSHTYAALGTFPVTLEVRDNDGGTHQVEVATIEVVNLVPLASADAPPAQANRVDPVQFRDRSTDRDGDVVGWRWRFGDGSTSAAQHPTYTYPALGTYEVTLEVTDGDGGKDEVVVGSIEVVNLLPTPAFEVDPRYPNVLVPVRFLDNSTDRDGTVASWRWQFGDGATSTQRNPIHVYLHGGFHDVTLTVQDNDGGVSSTTQRIFVCAPGMDLRSLLELEHVRIEFEACLRFTGVDYPF